MPVIRTRREWPANRNRGEMVRRLVEELSGRAHPDGPVVFDMPTEMIVVWDEWDGIPNAARSTVIEQARDEWVGTQPGGEWGHGVGLVIGATVAEALEMGLLPYAVRANLRPEHPRAREVEEELIRRGALRTPDGRVELRLTSLEQAEQQRDELRERFHDLEGASWEIERQHEWSVVD